MNLEHSIDAQYMSINLRFEGSNERMNKLNAYVYFLEL